ncbi:MAG: hypothetical protein WCL39_00455, partial [Armatimonadota bacterium]
MCSIVTGGLSADAGPRAAVVYSEFSGSSFKEAERPAFRELGWDYEAFENTHLSEFVQRLDRYDLVILTACYNLAFTQHFGAYAKEWKSFLQRGGILFVMDFENSPPGGISWLGQVSPEFLARPSGKLSPYATKPAEWIADHPLMRDVQIQELCYTYWDYVSPDYTPLVRDGDGRPVLAMQEVGDGVLLISTLYSGTSFPTSAFLRNLWQYGNDGGRRQYHTRLNAQRAHAKAPVLTVPRLVSRPKLDGNLSDPAWKDADRSAPFVAFDGSAAPDRTEMMAGYIGSDLYLAFRCSDSQPSKVRAFVRERDDPRCQFDDNVEICIQPQGSSSP